MVSVGDKSPYHSLTGVGGRGRQTRCGALPHHSGDFPTRLCPQSAQYGLDESLISAKRLLEIAVISVRDFLSQFKMALLKNLQ